MSAEMVKEIEELNEATSAFMKSHVILVANHYDLFTKIDGRRVTADEVAELLETDHRATRMLLDVLSGMNYLEKQNGTYRNSEVSSRLLVSGSPYYQGDSLRHRYRLWFSWSALRNVMKTGMPPENLTIEYEESEVQHNRNYVLAMENSGRIRADRLAEELDLTGVKNLLDLGGGPGTYAQTFARRNPGLRAVIYDLPEVCAISQEQIVRAGLSERVTTHPGDFLVDELGRGYDFVFISNIVHCYALPEVRKILRKSFGALNPGGRIVVKDFFVNEDRSGPLFSLLFAINMLVNTEAGDTHTFSHIEKELAGAGFTRLRRKKFTEQSWMILGNREGDNT